MRIRIEISRGEESTEQRAEVDALDDVPNVLFSLAQISGNGTYLAREDDGAPIFRLVTEWLE